MRPLVGFPGLISLSWLRAGRLISTPATISYMRTFTISEVRAGWVTAQVHSAQGSKTIVGSYTPNDAIRGLAGAVSSLATISNARRRWNQEPGETKWEFTRSADLVKVAVQSNQQFFECTFPWPRFGADVLDALRTLRSTMGTATYEHEWHYPFPTEACKKLEDAIYGDHPL